jgi:hypothetical protein
MKPNEFIYVHFEGKIIDGKINIGDGWASDAGIYEVCSQFVLVLKMYHSRVKLTVWYVSHVICSLPWELPAIRSKHGIPTTMSRKTEYGRFNITIRPLCLRKSPGQINH